MSSTGTAKSPEERAAILATQPAGTEFGGGGLSFLAGPNQRRDNTMAPERIPAVDAPITAAPIISVVTDGGKGGNGPTNQGGRGGGKGNASGPGTQGGGRGGANPGQNKGGQANGGMGGGSGTGGPGSGSRGGRD